MPWLLHYFYWSFFSFLKHQQLTTKTSTDKIKSFTGKQFLLFPGKPFIQRKKVAYVRSDKTADIRHIRSAPAS